MSDTLQIGPLTLPLQLLLVFAAVTLALLSAARLGRKTGVDAETTVFRIVVIAAVTARVAFVVQFHDFYVGSPWDMLDIRDGGWQPLAGAVAAWLCVVVLVLRRSNTRRPVAGALAVATLVWGLGTAGLAWRASDAPAMPDISLSGVTGQNVALSSFAGAPTVVNLWATWCPPCRREMPVMAKAQADNPGIHFVFLNQGESPAKVQAYLAAQGLDLRNVLFDTQGQTGRHFGQKALPATLFFDAQGLLVDKRIGELSHATLNLRLQALSVSSSSN